jgi:mRNA interferase YafQ
MRRVIFSRRFEKDVALLTRRGYKMEKLSQVMQRLAEGGALEDRFKDHPLRGNYEGFRECHIEPDWLLIYSLTEKDLRLTRTGTHADLFDK